MFVYLRIPYRYNTIKYSYLAKNFTYLLDFFVEKFMYYNGFSRVVFGFHEIDGKLLFS